MYRPKQGVQRQESVSPTFEGESGVKKKKKKKAGHGVKIEQEIVTYI